VAMTEKPLEERAARRRAAKERVRVFSGRLSESRAPESEPPWAGSRKMTVRGMGCWAESEMAARLVRSARRRRAAMGLAGRVKGIVCGRGFDCKWGWRPLNLKVSRLLAQFEIEELVGLLT